MKLTTKVPGTISINSALLTGSAFFFVALIIGCNSLQMPPLVMGRHEEQIQDDFINVDDEEGQDLNLSPTIARRGQSGDTPYFDWPVDEARMTRGFIPRAKRPHWGLDLAAGKGTPIFSAHAGTVIYTGRAFSGFGKLVIVENDTGWATLYAHLNKIYVREGQKVKQGHILGGMGRTGRATGVHLHFEIRQNHEPVDPLNYLPGGPLIQAQR